MLDSPEYGQLIVESFRTNAVRSALLIDNEFPTLADLVEGKEYNEGENASLLYSFFRRNKIACDIDNDIANLVSRGYERARKSDLVVLDYHLKGHDDATDAVDLLAKLADTDHFNLVVVLTKDEDLARVWLTIAATLRGGWRRPSDFFADEPDAYEEWEDFRQAGRFPEKRNDMLEDAICGRKMETSHRKELIECFRGSIHLRGVLDKACEAYISRAVEETAGAAVYGDASRRVIEGGDLDGETPWLICKSVFVVIANKAKHVSSTDSVFGPIDSALRKWRPNPVRLLLSEVQNVAETLAPAYAHRLTHDESTQAGWLYLAQKENAAIAPTGIPLAIESLCRNISAVFQGSLVASTGLQSFAKRLLDLLVQDGKAVTTDQGRLNLAINLVGAPLEPPKVLHAINVYLSSVPFDATHVTTGTVLHDPRSGDWWLCVQPACDLVPNQRKEGSYHCEMATLRLRPLTDWQSRLKDAHTGTMLYVRYEDAEKCFEVVNFESRHPNPETLLLRYGVDPPGKNGNVSRYHRVTVYRLNCKNEEPMPEKREMLAVAQLREPYASRFLLQAGHHASRIGIDFTSFNADDSTVPASDALGPNNE